MSSIEVVSLLASPASTSDVTDVAAEESSALVEKPVFEFAAVVGNRTQFYCQAPATGLGVAEMRIPFRIPAPFTYVSATPDLIDLTAAGLGGVVDDLGTFTAYADYILWAFHSGTAYQGMGLTLRPKSIASDFDSGIGTPGGLATFVVVNGNLFNLGARVTVKQDENLGSQYNQGVITAKTSTSLTIQLDADYGASVQNNTDVSALIGGIIIQNDNFAPNSNTDGLPFNGYYYSQLGTIRADATLGVATLLIEWRKRGDEYLFDGLPFIYDVTDTAAPAAQQLCLARWIPFGIQTSAILTAQVSGTGANRAMIVSQYLGSGSLLATMTDASVSTNIVIRQKGQVETLPYEQSIYVQALKTGALLSTVWQLQLDGYLERAF